MSTVCGVCFLTFGSASLNQIVVWSLLLESLLEKGSVSATGLVLVVPKILKITRTRPVALTEPFLLEEDLDD